MVRELDFDAFFARGELLSDISALSAFAMLEERRGNLADAAQLYRWTLELIEEAGELDQDLRDIRFGVGEALSRLDSGPRFAA